MIVAKDASRGHYNAIIHNGSRVLNAILLHKCTP